MASRSPIHVKRLLPIVFSADNLSHHLVAVDVTNTPRTQDLLNAVLSRMASHTVSILIPGSPRRDKLPMAPMKPLYMVPTLQLFHHIYSTTPSDHHRRLCVPLLPEPPRRLRLLIPLCPNPLQPSRLLISPLLKSFWPLRLLALGTRRQQNHTSPRCLTAPLPETARPFRSLVPVLLGEHQLLGLLVLPTRLYPLSPQRHLLVRPAPLPTLYQPDPHMLFHITASL